LNEAVCDTSIATAIVVSVSIICATGFILAIILKGMSMGKDY